MTRLDPPTLAEATGRAPERESPDEFFGRLLDELTALDAVGSAAVWAINPQGVVDRVVERSGDPPAGDPAARTHLAIEAMTKGVLCRSAGDASRATWVAPVGCDGKPAAAIEVAFRPGETLDHASIEKALQEIVRRAERYVSSKASETPRAPPPRADAAQLLSVALRLHRPFGVEQAALVAANELRSACGVDRVSVAVVSRRGMKVAAVSGSESVARQSESAQSLRVIAERAFETGRRARFGQRCDAEDDPLHDALARHIAATRAVAIEAIPVGGGEAAGDDAGAQRPAAVLLLEDFTERDVAARELAVGYLGDHVGAALRNAARRERVLRFWPRWVRSWVESPTGERDARRVAYRWAVGLALLVAAACVPVPHRVAAPGRLAPETTSVLFAPAAADVAEVLVSGGQRVDAGDLLVRLSSEPLTSKLLALESRLRQRRRSLSALRAESEEVVDATTEIRIGGRIAQAEVEIAGLEAQLADLRRELKALEIRAPHAGRVATFDPEGLLRQRPVGRGDALVEVMDFDGAWKLRLDCPIDRYGCVADAVADEGEPLPVSFVLATDPGRSLTATTTRTASRALTRPTGERVVVVEAAVDPGQDLGDASDLAEGEVAAKIRCGREPLAYVLFGRAYDAVRMWWW